MLKEKRTVNQEFWVEISFRKEVKTKTFSYEGKLTEFIANIISQKIP